MTLSLIVFTAALCLALGNGANDNFKGVATLFGSGTANYRQALLWATVTTLLGSMTAVFLASGLIQTFTGKGLAPAMLVTDPGYLGAVALGAAGTILVATRLGMPVSTTHALVGGLIGPAWIAGGQIGGTTLAWKFFGPLLISPLLAILFTVVLHRLFRRMRLKLGVVEQTCLCVGTEPEPIAVAPSRCGEMALLESQRISASLGTQQTCLRRYAGNVAGIKASSLLDWLHYLSAGLVSFARGLNDTPKIAALMVAGAGLAGLEGGVSVGLAMAVGGLLAARRVADTMSHKVTPMNAGQGFTANLVTGLIVIGASRLGVPVSTTHVSCGGIFGVGAVTSDARWPVIRRIIASWILTLPVSAVAAAAIYLAISRL